MANTLMSLLVSIGADTSAFQKGVKDVEKNSKNLGASSAEITQKNTQLLLSIGSIALATGTAIKSVLTEHVAYANSIRELAAIGDTSVESASRFVQVLDDYKISANDAATASRALKDNGLVPTIETLAKLSDAYLSIQDPAEKMQFIQDNLGRSGIKYIEILNKGSAALLEQSAAVDDSLILTQKMVDDARRAEIAMDNWSDAVDGLKTAFSIGLLPVLTKVGNHFNDVITSLKENGYWYTFLHQLNLKDIADRREQATALMLEKGAVDQLSLSLENVVDPAKEAQAALQSMSSLNQDYISGVMSYAGSESNYRENQKNQLERIAEAQQNLTNAVHEYGSGSKEALDATAELDGAKAGLKDLERQWKETTTRMVFDMMQTRFMSDGVLSEVETDALSSFAQREGLMTEAQAAEYKRLTAIAEFQVRAVEGADAWISKMELQKQSLGQVTTMVNDVGAALSGLQQVQIPLPLVSVIGDGSLASSYSPYSSVSTPKSNSRGGRALGGSVFAGTPYTVGEHGMETFVPNTNGKIVPNNTADGQNITIINNITNPKREAAEDSIRKSLKSLSYMGVATT